MYLITWITTHLPILSWPCWLTDSGRLNYKVVTRPASSLAQDRESSPAETSLLPTMLRRQQGVGQTDGHRTTAGITLCNVQDLMNDGDSCTAMTTVDLNGLP